jgi:hypothetical protein
VTVGDGGEAGGRPRSEAGHHDHGREGAGTMIPARNRQYGHVGKQSNGYTFESSRRAGIYLFHNSVLFCGAAYLF